MTTQNNHRSQEMAVQARQLTQQSRELIEFIQKNHELFFGTEGAEGSGEPNRVLSLGEPSAPRLKSVA